MVSCVCDNLLERLTQIFQEEEKLYKRYERKGLRNENIKSILQMRTMIKADQYLTEHPIPFCICESHQRLETLEEAIRDYKDELGPKYLECQKRFFNDPNFDRIWTEI